MIDLSKNTNPYFPNKKILKYFKKNIKRINEYSSETVYVSDQKFLNNYDLKPENTLITNGTLGAMDLILRNSINKKVGMFSPTFWGIKELAKRNNNKIIEKKLIIAPAYNNKEIDELASQVDILYLCNCNNPTLNYIQPNELINIIKSNQNCLFIIDETVLTFNVNYLQKTILRFVNEIDNLIVLISLSKIFGICGLRMGVMVSSIKQIENNIKKQVPYSVNILSSKLAEKHVHLLFELEYQKSKIENDFNYFIKKANYSFINNIIYNSSSFILLELNDDVNYKKIVSYLNNSKIKVAAINDYYFGLNKKYLRISAGRKKDFIRLNKVFRKFGEDYRI